MQDVGREKPSKLIQLGTLYATLLTCQTRRACWYNSGIVSMGVTKHFLIFWRDLSVFPNPETNDDWYYKPGQKPVAEEAIDSSEEAITVILLNGHIVSIKLHTNDLCPQISAAQVFGQKAFSQRSSESWLHNWLAGSELSVLGRTYTSFLPGNTVEVGRAKGRGGALRTMVLRQEMPI